MIIGLGAGGQSPVISTFRLSACHDCPLKTGLTAPFPKQDFSRHIKTDFEF